MRFIPCPAIHRVEAGPPAMYGPFLIESFMVRPDERRRLLFDLDVSVVNLRMSERRPVIPMMVRPWCS